MIQEARLPGIRMTLKKPRVAAESVGYCWYPQILKFSTGELMLIHSLNSDSNESFVTAQAVQLSTDGGQTWGYSYDINGFMNSGGEVRLGLPDGSIVGPGTHPIRPDPDGQWRRFVAHYWRFDQGGRRYLVEPWATTIEGFPRDVAHRTVWSRWDWSRINLFGSAVDTGSGRFVTTCPVTFAEDTRSSTVALVSEDAGRTWHYLSTIAGPDDIPDAREGFDEPCTIRLANGDLMCVSRVGGGRDQPLARTYSSDGGRSWSPIDRLPAWSVAPNMLRLENGIIAISTGRPGIYLWLSTDARGESWHAFDVMGFHNDAMEPQHHISAGPGGLAALPVEGYKSRSFDFDNPDQTTAYTSMVEVSPNRLLLVYDRMPYGWMPVPTDAQVRSRILAEYPLSSLRLTPDSIRPRERERIYLLEIDLERT